MFLEINNLSFKYDNSTQYALKDLSLSLREGEILSVFGNSGSGKSTLLRIIAGLERASKGSCVIDNIPLFSEDNFTLPEKRGIGMVFQDYALFPHMTVQKNIEFGIDYMSKSYRRDRVKELLELVDLQGYEKRYPHELSGGQMQRVAIARALAPSPSILLLDEPFSNLDKDLQEKIRLDIKNILKQSQTTCIFVTHDRDDYLAIADKVATLHLGELQSIENIMR